MLIVIAILKPNFINVIIYLMNVRAFAAGMVYAMSCQDLPFQHKKSQQLVCCCSNILNPKIIILFYLQKSSSSLHCLIFSLFWIYYFIM